MNDMNAPPIKAIMSSPTPVTSRNEAAREISSLSNVGQDCFIHICLRRYFFAMTFCGNAFLTVHCAKIRTAQFSHTSLNQGRHVECRETSPEPM
jgi:hypothetical protein